MFEYSEKYKLTFKNDARNTGLAACGQMIGATIKYRKKCIGRIHRNALHMPDSGMYKVGFSVFKPEDGCWSWVYSKKLFNTMEEAKEWASFSFKAIVDNFQSKGWTIHEIDY